MKNSGEAGMAEDALGVSERAFSASCKERKEGNEEEW